MPSYGIHRAVGAMYLKHNKLTNPEAFMEGIVKPDVLSDLGGESKVKTHFGYKPKVKEKVKNDFKSKCNLYLYLTSSLPKTDLDMGYFLHLITDHLWFYRFLYYPGFEKVYTKKLLYHDYACVAKEVERVYHVQDGMPPLSWATIEDEPKLFSRKGMHVFIEYCAKLNLAELISQILCAKQHWAEVQMLKNCPNSADFL